MFLGLADDDGKRYTERDRELLKALRLYELARCPGCGFSKAETWVEPEDREFDYIVEEVQCQTCAALQSEQAGKKTEKGLHYYIDRRPLGSHTGHEHTEREVDEN